MQLPIYIKAILQKMHLCRVLKCCRMAAIGRKMTCMRANADLMMQASLP